MSNLRDKLEIDDSIHLHNWLHVKSNCGKKVRKLFVHSEDVSKALKICKKLSKPMKGLLKNILVANLDVFA